MSGPGDPPALLAVTSALSYEGWLLFFHGTWVGVAVTAPPGPVGGMAVRRTLRDGIWRGLSTALGALLADLFYGALAVFGLSQLAEPTGWVRQALAVGVAALLVVLGVRYVRVARAGTVDLPPPKEGVRAAAGLLGTTVSTFFLTLWTPATLPSFVAIFAALGLGARAGDCEGGAFLVLAGVLVGAAAWWLALCGLAHRFRTVAGNWLRWMEFGVAVLMFVGAAIALWQGFRPPSV